MGQDGMQMMVACLLIVCWVLPAFPLVLACQHLAGDMLWARRTCNDVSLLDHPVSDLGASLHLLASCSLCMKLVAKLANLAACHTFAATRLRPLSFSVQHAHRTKSKRSDGRLAPWDTRLSLGCLTHQARAGTRGPPGHLRTTSAAASHAPG